jgi:thiamine biosynthesis lipoprotein
LTEQVLSPTLRRFSSDVGITHVGHTVVVSADQDLHRFTKGFEPLVGTVVEIRVALNGDGDAAESAAARIADTIVDEITRLEAIFSAVSTSSELSRWSRGEIEEPGAELRSLLGVALEWVESSGGRFNPASGILSAYWRDAEVNRVVPDREVLSELAGTIDELPWSVVDDHVIQTGDCRNINLNAFAKGWIVDRSAEMAMARFAPNSVSVNAGGDLVQLGAEPLTVGIENPLRPYDNEPALLSVNLSNEGLATSGRARRGFVIGGERYGHVIDPRTGWPVDHIASISVIADNAATADVLATILGMLEPSAALAEADSYGAGCFIVDSAGAQFMNERWRAALS